MEEATIISLHEQMDKGIHSSRSIAEMYLERIEKLDKQGPAVNAVMELNPDVLDITDALDLERKERGSRGPLHGIPVMIKDNIDTADRMMTTAGSIALEESIPSKDAFVVKKLRQAGAVILGKTNLSEWANFRSTRSTSGWSSRRGQTRNPYALDRNPSGSSSGSAVAVSANLCSVAVGTETNGSIISPAQANGIVGIKPTVGLISRSGIIPISHSQDTAGPMARTVTEAAILLGVLAGADPEDPITEYNPAKVFMDYTSSLDRNGMRGARIGIARNFFGFSKKVDAIMETCIEEMKRLGAVIVDPVKLDTVRDLQKPGFQVLLYEFKTNMNRYLSRLNPEVPVRSLKSLIDFNERHQEKIMPYFGQEIFHMSEDKGPLSSMEYLDALETCNRLSKTEGIDKAMERYQLDAVAAPSGGPAWMSDLIQGDHPAGGSAAMAAIAGYPNITLPAGYIFGLPVGISFFSSAFQEPILIKLAYALEQATQIRRPPGFLPTVDLNA